jgi:hypothetical protein
MPGNEPSEIEYRGYTFVAVERLPGWKVYIYPGHRLLHTDPDHVSELTKEDALRKARAIVDYRLSS